MVRDVPRNQIPATAAWNLVDGIPNQGAAWRERGGYSYASANITSTKATASYVVAGLVAPFSAGTKNLAIDEDGELYVIVSSSSTTDVGAAVAPVQNPVFHRNKAIIPASDGTTAPKYYDGSTLGNLGGSPPAGKYATVFKDRTVLARSSANPNRLWFSGPGDPTTWDTTNGYWDSSQPVNAIAALRNAIVIFHDSSFERLRGSIPPPGSDFIMEFGAAQGCTDARSIVNYGDTIVFANTNGVWITDGTTPLDLTTACGIKTYWQDLFASYSASTWTIAGGIIKKYYVVTIMNGSSFVDCGIFDLENRIFFRASNIDATSFWGSIAAQEELYFGRRGAARVGYLSSIFMKSSTVKNDADGTAVTSTLETGYFMGREPQVKRWKKAHATYDLRDAASDNPTMSISYVSSPELTNYTTPSGPDGASVSALSETSAIKKDRVSLNTGETFGLGLKISRTNASSDFRLYAVEVEVSEQEGGRKKQ